MNDRYQNIGRDAYGPIQENKGTVNQTFNFDHRGEPTFPIHQLPPANLHFTGRQALLKRLGRRLNTDHTSVISQMQTISGLGGVGKSQLALAYAHAQKASFDLIWWLTAEPESSLAAEIVTLGRALHLPVDGQQSQDAMVKTVHGWLAGTDKRWLLIYDNADSVPPRRLRPYLPGGGEGSILITSRNPHWQGVVGKKQVMTLDVFMAEEAAVFWQERLETSEAAADALAELSTALGHLPLALEQAAAYMETRQTAPDTYLRLFQERRQALWTHEAAPDSYHATIAATWDLAFDHARLTPGAADLLNLCCCLAPDNIPLELIVDHHIKLPSPLTEVLADELSRAEAVQALRRYSLIRVDNGKLHVHRLVQMVAQDRMGAERRQHWVETAVDLLLSWWPFEQNDMTTWPASRDLLPQLEAAARFAEQIGLQTASTATLNAHLGYFIGNYDNYQLALPYSLRALAIREAALGSDHPDTARSLNNLGFLLLTMGKLPAAKPYLERALAIRESALGPDHPDTALSLNNLGFLLQAMGDLPAAIPYFERALAISESTLGPDHPDTARSLNNLGALLQDKGNLPAAKPYYERALAISESALGPDHPDTARSLNNLGFLLQAMGDLPAAKPYFERALAISESKLGPDHPDTALSLNNLGFLLQAMGDLPAAKPYLERTLAISESALGPDHPDTALSLNNLAILSYYQGKYKESARLMRRALTIRQTKLGDEHTDTITSRNSLAIIEAKLTDSSST